MSKKVLFVCLGNSCRSQIAEAFAKAYGEGLVEVYSAGIKPAGFVHKKAIAVMDEIGIDVRGQTSKPIDPQILAKADWIVTLADDAKEKLPPLRNHTIHWPIDDPVAVFGKEERILQAFRITRDEIERRVQELIEQLKQP